MADPVDNLIAEIADAGEKLTVSAESSDEIKEKRESLKLAATAGDLDKSVKAVEKLTPKGVESLYAEWEKLRHLRRQTFLCDLFLNKFAQVLGRLRMVQKPEALEMDLNEDQLLRSDVTKVISYVEPYIPFVGILSGALTVASHVFSNGKEEEEEGTKQE